MPKRSDEELERIFNRFEEIILEKEDGISRPDLQVVYKNQYGEKLPDRSVNRWLKEMVQEKRIQPRGEGKNRRYLPPDDVKMEQKVTVKSDSIHSQLIKESSEKSLPLSERGKEIRQKVRRPKSEREPIGYNRDFLDRYQPESTYYLSPETRKELQDVGKTPEQNRPAGTYARQILEPLLIDLSWSSSRLEGNTYSHAETRDLIQMGKEATGKDPTEAQMILNHQSAIKFLVGNIGKIGFDKPTILTIHASLSENLMGNPRKEGAIRTGQGGIGESTYTPQAIPQEIERCFGQMLDKIRDITDPFEQAFFIMVHLPYLQPFWDVNKRTSRIAANIPLFQQNYSPLSFIDVPRGLYIEALLGIYEFNRYELLRDVFVWAYKRSCKRYEIVKDSVEAPDPIRLKYRDELEKVIRSIVLKNNPPSSEVVKNFSSDLEISEKDAEKFTQTALELLKNLNQGKAGRYKISLEALKNWKNKFSDHL